MGKLLVFALLLQTPQPDPWVPVRQAIYRGCLAQYHALPWWRRMWYRHDGACERYLKPGYGEY